MRGAVHVGDQPETPAIDHDLASLRVEALDLRVGRVRRAVARGDRDAEPVRRDAGRQRARRADHGGGLGETAGSGPLSTARFATADLPPALAQGRESAERRNDLA